MFSPVFHPLFDVLAVSCALASSVLIYKWWLSCTLEQTVAKLSPFYFLALSSGSLLGAFGLGTLNLYLSGTPAIGRSILTIFGAIITIEIYKAIRGVKGSTGYMYAVPFCVLVMIGRLGCFFSGLHDETFGTPTTLPWAVDFGDGVFRHPVQLYESVSMFLFMVGALITLQKWPSVFVRYGFYACVGFYAFQRFMWEFLKPYGAIVSNLNVFHVVCLILMLYSAVMIMQQRNNKNDRPHP